MTITIASDSSGQVSTDSTSWTASYPSGIEKGDLLLLFAVTDGNPGTFNPGAGWASFIYTISDSSIKMMYAKRYADGTETGNFTISVGTAEQGQWMVLRIPKDTWIGDIGAASGGFTGGVNNVVGPQTGIANAAPDSASLNPQWAAMETLWLSVVGMDGNAQGLNAYPSNMTGYSYQNASNSTGAELGIATAITSDETFDPAAFDIDTGTSWIAITLAVRGVPVGFPVIEHEDTASGHVTSNTANWTLTYPTNIVAGDLLLALVAMDGVGGGSSSGWVANFAASGANQLIYLKKKAAGTETGTFALVNASEQGSWVVYRITNWEGTLGSLFDNTANSGAVDLATATAVDANPNPPSLNPNNWDVENTLWLAPISVDTSRTVSTFPYTDFVYSDPSGGSGGATLGICAAYSAVASLDPGTYAISTGDDWVAATLAIRPAPSYGLPILRRDRQAIYAM